MVQIGNEINNGMQWPHGRVSDIGKLADLIKAGNRGVDAYAAPGTPARPAVMLHIACGGDTAVTRWFFDNAEARGVAYDAIGLAYKLLGSRSDADDVVQDAWLRWRQADRSAIRDAEAWLVTATTRLGIDSQRLSRTERAANTGPWLPEPITVDE